MPLNPIWTPPVEMDEVDNPNLTVRTVNEQIFQNLLALRTPTSTIEEIDSEAYTPTEQYPGYRGSLTRIRNKRWRFNSTTPNILVSVNFNIPREHESKTLPHAIGIMYQEPNQRIKMGNIFHFVSGVTVNSAPSLYSGSNAVAPSDRITLNYTTLLFNIAISNIILILSCDVLGSYPAETLLNDATIYATNL